MGSLFGGAQTDESFWVWEGGPPRSELERAIAFGDAFLRKSIRLNVCVVDIHFTLAKNPPVVTGAVQLDESGRPILPPWDDDFNRKLSCEAIQRYLEQLWCKSDILHNLLDVHHLHSVGART